MKYKDLFLFVDSINILMHVRHNTFWLIIGLHCTILVYLSIGCTNCPNRYSPKYIVESTGL